MPYRYLSLTKYFLQCRRILHLRHWFRKEWRWQKSICSRWSTKKYNSRKKKLQEIKNGVCRSIRFHRGRLILDSNISSTFKHYDIRVYTFQLNIKDKLSDIMIKVSHSLIARNEPVQPVLDDLTPSHSFTTVKIYRDCGNDDICQADLRLESNLWVHHWSLWTFWIVNKVFNHNSSAKHIQPMRYWRG